MRPQYFYALISFGFCVLGIGSILWLDYRQPEGINNTLLMQVLGILTPTSVVILNLLRSAGNSEGIRDTDKHVRTWANEQNAENRSSAAREGRDLPPKTEVPPNPPNPN